MLSTARGLATHWRVSEHKARQRLYELAKIGLAQEVTEGVWHVKTSSPVRHRFTVVAGILFLISALAGIAAASSVSADRDRSYLTDRQRELHGMTEATGELETAPETSEAPTITLSAETRSERLQRALRADGETAAEIVGRIVELKPSIGDQFAYELAWHIARECRNRDVRPELVVAVAWHESRFDPRARSHAGAAGLMQFMPGTARSYGVTDRSDWRQSVTAGVAYLSDLTRGAGGSERVALARYNGGPRPPVSSYRYADAVLKTAGNAQ